MLKAEIGRMIADDVPIKTEVRSVDSALTYFELAAHAVGVGCCWGGYLTMATRDYAPLREYLGITDEEHLCGAQMFGYPTLRPTRQYPGRKELNLTIL